MNPKWLMFSTSVDYFQASRLVYEQDLSTAKQRLYGTKIADAFSIKSNYPNDHQWQTIVANEKLWQQYQNNVHFYLSYDGILIVQINDHPAIILNQGVGLNYYDFPQDYDQDLLSKMQSFFSAYPHLVNVNPHLFQVQKIWLPQPINPHLVKSQTSLIFQLGLIKASAISSFLIRYFQTNTLMLGQDFLTITNLKKPSKWTKPQVLKDLKIYQDVEFNVAIEIDRDGIIKAYLQAINDQLDFKDQVIILANLNAMRKNKNQNERLIFKTKYQHIALSLELLLSDCKWEQPITIVKTDQFLWDAQFVEISNDIRSHFAKQFLN